MGKEQVILDTIKRLKGSGIDDETIKSTLLEIGLSEKEIEEYIAEAAGKKAPPAQKAEPAKAELQLEEEQEEEAGQEEQEPKEQEEQTGAQGLEEQGEEELVGDEDLLEDDSLPQEEEEGEADFAHEKIAQRTAQKVKAHLDDRMEEQELHHASTRAELEEHGTRLSDMHRSLDALHTKVDLAPQMPLQTISQISVIEKRINQIEKELGEIRANTNALSSLMKKIIETEREILNELKKQ